MAHDPSNACRLPCHRYFNQALACRLFAIAAFSKRMDLGRIAIWLVGTALQRVDEKLAIDDGVTIAYGTW
jgi:hypothetical protein